jgi:hypothetical protein
MVYVSFVNVSSVSVDGLIDVVSAVYIANYYQINHLLIKFQYMHSVSKIFEIFRTSCKVVFFLFVW